MRKAALKLSIIVGCILIALEVSVRMLVSVPEERSRYLFWSAYPFIELPNGTLRYIPDSTIREVAVYNGSIEYDYTFQTNTQGYADAENYRERSDAITLLGDSFAVGVGAGAWIPSIPIYNLGMHGAGFVHFQRFLQRSAESLPVNRIVILAISDDIYRSEWRPMLSENTVRFCPNREEDNKCLHRSPVAYVMEPDAAPEDILRMTREIESSKTPNKQYGPSRVFDFLIRRILGKPVFSGGEGSQRISKSLLSVLKKENIKALQSIRSEYADTSILLMHLPQKHEVESRSYSVDYASIADDVSITYYPALTRCVWSKDLYHRNDQHLNAAGYDRLRECFEVALSYE